MVRRNLVAVAALLAAGCAPLGSGPAPTRAPDFKPSEIRQPAVLVRVSVSPGQFDEREVPTVAGDYEGALLEGFNARAVLVRDVRRAGDGGPRFESGAALARAREVGADHAILVDVRVGREIVVVCRETRRPLRGPATVWSQDIEVLRARDGATRLRLVDDPALAVNDVEIDCDDPKSARRRPPLETLTRAVDRLLTRLLGP